MAFSRRSLFKFSSGIMSLLIYGKRGFASKSQGDSRGLERARLEKISQIFRYGLASGDPEFDRVILWTHVTSSDPVSTPVKWQVSLDSDFSEVLLEGVDLAHIDHDFTVKVDVLLPFPATTYYYRFWAEDCCSMTGRTRTAPNFEQNIRLAIVSCSSIWSGYFNAYEAIAQRDDIDLVIHCGDYIYDVPDPQERRNMSLAEADGRSPRNLEEVRRRYRYYRSDAKLRSAHQQHPWVIIWDNHDIENEAGKEASLKAFHEWTPIRSPVPGDHNFIYRKLSYGPMLEIIMIDTRHIGRDSISAETGSKSILGDRQFSWLKEQLDQSRPAHWRVLANQVLFAPFKIFGKSLTEMVWDGYEGDRNRLLKYLANSGLNNNVIVTGDAHLSFANNLSYEGRSVAVEFLPSSLTRGNLDEQVAASIKTLAAAGFESAVKLFNPHIRYFESTRQGYGIADFRREGATLEFWYVPHYELSLDQSMARSFYVSSGLQKISNENISTPTLGVNRAPAAPPEPRLYVSPGELGGLGGQYFDDCELFDSNTHLISVSIRSGERLDGISSSYEDGLICIHGGEGGSSQSLVLFPNEYFRCMSIGVNKYKGLLSVHYVQLLTSHGRVLEGGRRTPEIKEFIAPLGRHIIGFRGRKGQEIDKIGPIYAPDFE
ncbi:MAG: alkaline phosphatase D family protein [Proteobacteria bacterium]|nr:alkaline phosphatase D family protein [Pseudomonadota bacterium]